MELGTNCRYQYCQQKDFLPFSCSLCSRSYCLEHRTASSHECEKQNDQKKAIVCPICNQTIKYNTQSNLNESEIWEIHSATECNETPYIPKEQLKQKCPAEKCNKDLTQLNIHECKRCNKKVCLKHRMPEDHQCGIVIKTVITKNQQPSYNFNNPYNQSILNNPWN